MLELNILFEFWPFFGTKIGQFFMKNDNICFAFENWPSTLDDFKRQKVAQIVFLCFYARVYIWSRTIPLNIIFWAKLTFCTKHTKNIDWTPNPPYFFSIKSYVFTGLWRRTLYKLWDSVCSDTDLKGDHLRICTSLTPKKGLVFCLYQAEIRVGGV